MVCVSASYTWLALCLSLLSTCSWCVLSASTWLALCLSLLSTCSWCVGERIHLIGSMSSLLPHPTCSWCGGERIHLIGSMTPLLLSTCSWLGVSAYTWLALWLSLLSTCSWCVVSAYTWLAHVSLSSPPVADLGWAHTLDCLDDSPSLSSTCSWWCGERIHLIGSISLSPLHL